MGIEIEKKFTVKELPKELNKYPYHIIEQGYLCVNPAVRVSREDDKHYMTYKGFAPANEGGILMNARQIIHQASMAKWVDIIKEQQESGLPIKNGVIRTISHSILITIGNM